MDGTAQGNVRKEQEPVGGTPTFIEQVERQPEIPPEVAQVGVQPVQGPTLTQDDQQAGLETSKEEVPAATEPEGLVNLPLTEQEARSTLRIHKNIKEAIVWLANWVLRQFEIFKLKEKNAN